MLLKYVKKLIVLHNVLYQLFWRTADQFLLWHSFSASGKHQINIFGDGWKSIDGKDCIKRSISENKRRCKEIGQESRIMPWSL